MLQFASLFRQLHLLQSIDNLWNQNLTNKQKCAESKPGIKGLPVPFMFCWIRLCAELLWATWNAKIKYSYLYLSPHKTTPPSRNLENYFYKHDPQPTSEGRYGEPLVLPPEYGWTTTSILVMPAGAGISWSPTTSGELQGHHFWSKVIEARERENCSLKYIHLTDQHPHREFPTTISHCLIWYISMCGLQLLCGSDFHPFLVNAIDMDYDQTKEWRDKIQKTGCTSSHLLT